MDIFPENLAKLFEFKLKNHHIFSQNFFPVKQNLSQKQNIGSYANFFLKSINSFMVFGKKKKPKLEVLNSKNLSKFSFFLLSFLFVDESFYVQHGFEEEIYEEINYFVSHCHQ